jgi:hypothetical protein
MDIAIQPDYVPETEIYPTPFVAYQDFPTWTLCTILLPPHTIKLFLPLGGRL